MLSLNVLIPEIPGAVPIEILFVIILIITVTTLIRLVDTGELFPPNNCLNISLKRIV